ncbi:MAG: hypothetical protein ACOYXT_23925 [Bacteroidota bacterium]
MSPQEYYEQKNFDEVLSLYRQGRVDLGSIEVLQVVIFSAFETSHFNDAILLSDRLLQTLDADLNKDDFDLRKTIYHVLIDSSHRLGINRKVVKYVIRGERFITNSAWAKPFITFANEHLQRVYNFTAIVTALVVFGLIALQRMYKIFEPRSYVILMGISLIFSLFIAVFPEYAKKLIAKWIAR